MRRSGQEFFRFSLERGTVALCAVTTFFTLIYAFAPTWRVYLEVTPLTFGEPTLLGLFTHGFVAGPGGPFGVFFLVALGAYFMWPSVKRLWRRSRGLLIGFTLCTSLLAYAFDRALGGGLGFGLLADLLLLVWFGISIESRWGTHRFLAFGAFILTALGIASALTGWVWPAAATTAQGFVVPVRGADPLITSLMTVWCLMFGRVRLAILNIEARKLIWVLVALGVLDMAFGPTILGGLVDLWAVLFTVLLVTGLWRPRHLIDRLRLELLERRVRRRRSGIHIVKNDERYH